MRFSIAIPAYDNEHTLIRALNSVAAQNFNDIEIIVSDDCSQKSDLKKICDNFKIKNPKIFLRYYFQEKNLKAVLNIKFVLQKAEGDYIMLLPHDDFLVDKNFFIECNKIINHRKDVGCIIANTIYEDTKKKLVNIETESWKNVKNTNKYIIEFFANPPAYSAIFFRKEILYNYGYFDLFFSKNDYEKFNYQPDEIMTAPILSIFHSNAVFSGKVVSVRGIGEDNFSRSKYWKNTYRISVAMPLLKLYFYFKDKNKFLSKHFLKLSIFRYCFYPLSIQSLFHFKRFDVFLIMIFSNLFYKLRFYRGVNSLVKKLVDLDLIFKK